MANIIHASHLLRIEERSEKEGNNKAGKPSKQHREPLQRRKKNS